MGRKSGNIIAVGAVEGESTDRYFFQNAGGKVRMLADTTGALAKALDLELDLSAVLGSVRCKRFFPKHGGLRGVPEGAS